MNFLHHKHIRVLLIVALLITSVAFVAAGAAQATCDAEVADASQLTAAINQANDESACPGANTIRVLSDFVVDTPASNDNYGQVGANAFPVITSSITIVGAEADGTQATISRSSTASPFRFFFVEANNQGGRLTLDNVALTAGNAQRGAAIFVNGTPQTDSTDVLLTVNNSLFTSNVSMAGTIVLSGIGDLTVFASITNSIFENNQSGQGGAIYNDARGNGTIDLELANTRIVSNRANMEGGAIYNNQAGGISITINATDTDFFFNTQGRGEVQCFNNGRGITFNINSSNRATSEGCGQALVSTEAEAQAILQTPLRVLGTGDVQVTLSWDNQSDMDLAVTEPNGERVHHGLLLSTTGGRLDVDSNYPCGTNPLGIENVVWATDAPEGSYTVEVGVFDLCGAAGNPNWSLTVRVGGQIVLEEQGNTNNSFTFTVPAS